MRVWEYNDLNLSSPLLLEIGVVKTAAVDGRGLSEWFTWDSAAAAVTAANPPRSVWTTVASNEKLLFGICETRKRQDWIHRDDIPMPL